MALKRIVDSKLTSRNVGGNSLWAAVPTNFTYKGQDEMTSRTRSWVSLEVYLMMNHPTIMLYASGIFVRFAIQRLLCLGIVNSSTGISQLICMRIIISFWYPVSWSECKEKEEWHSFWKAEVSMLCARFTWNESNDCPNPWLQLFYSLFTVSTWKPFSSQSYLLITLLAVYMFTHSPETRQAKAQWYYIPCIYDP